ncbi:hypothetical protein SEMRO_157_G071270.1 [Seminavis robusta]|uniref:Uncharacterized protein n=1 Tax=Seminavis robusta TaxID=568900 RepID=A0A9N8DLY7_9STRA|nr:hypothetical protein SEMRO_157_G071270.1 [Seminavis robusta]|eukprot:Sro157_g071270.1 n/a (106) ;mRNA; r:71527-71844
MATPTSTEQSLARASGPEDFDMALSLCKSALVRMQANGDDESINQKLEAMAVMMKCFGYKQANHHETSASTYAQWDQLDDAIWVNGILPFVGMGIMPLWQESITE